MRLVTAVRKALAGHAPAAADQGAAELALTYARAIDDGGDLDRLGPQLLAVLDALHMTPRARAAVKGGSGDSGTRSPLDELRARRARKRDPATVDTATG